MKTIFLIDDDDEDRMIFKDAVACLNVSFDFIEARDGKEALLMISKMDGKKPDFIFLDLNMPKVDGYKVLVSLKQNAAYNAIPIYILSTSSDTIEKKKCLDAGATDFITKHNCFGELCKKKSYLMNL